MEVNPYLSAAERGILGRAVVGIAGAGGLGSNCAMHLVRSGVRRLVIADFDRVAESNLNRQFFFADQIGCRKVEALGRNLRRIVPELELELHDSAVTAENAAGRFGRCDIVVEAFDSSAREADADPDHAGLREDGGRRQRPRRLGEKQRAAPAPDGRRPAVSGRRF